MKNNVKKIDEKGEKITKPYLKDHNLLREHNLCQAHYQILLTILLKKTWQIIESC